MFSASGCLFENKSIMAKSTSRHFDPPDTVKIEIPKVSVVLSANTKFRGGQIREDSKIWLVPRPVKVLSLI